MAAQLSADADLQVRRHKGHLGELRVAVDGTDVVDNNPLWYPTPASVVERVGTYLVSGSAQAGSRSMPR